MNAIPFARIVREMRALQKEFFRTPVGDRPPDLIRRAKEKERDVDAAIREILGQPSFFDREDDPNVS